MTVFWILATIVTILGLLAFILAPVVLGARLAWARPTDESELDRHLDEKARLLRGLKDLEQEQASGLIDEPEYKQARQDYLGRAADLNRKITAITGTPEDDADPAPATATSEPDGSPTTTPTKTDGDAETKADAETTDAEKSS